MDQLTQSDPSPRHCFHRCKNPPPAPLIWKVTKFACKKSFPTRLNTFGRSLLYKIINWTSRIKPTPASLSHLHVFPYPESLSVCPPPHYALWTFFNFVPPPHPPLPYLLFNIFCFWFIYIYIFLFFYFTLGCSSLAPTNLLCHYIHKAPLCSSSRPPAGQFILQSIYPPPYLLCTCPNHLSRAALALSNMHYHSDELIPPPIRPRHSP